MPAVIDHPILAALLSYWQGKRGSRPLPARREIDPLEMGPALLPYLLLCDLLDRGTRVRFRLVGTVVVKRLGFDPTGKYLDAVMKGRYCELLAALHRLVYCERAPLFCESDFTWGTGRRMSLQHLLLPLTLDGPDPAIALGGIAFASDEAFPPTVRALNECAVLSERRRHILTPATIADWPRGTGRQVA